MTSFKVALVLVVYAARTFAVSFDDYLNYKPVLGGHDNVKYKYGPYKDAQHLYGGVGEYDFPYKSYNVREPYQPHHGLQAHNKPYLPLYSPGGYYGSSAPYSHESYHHYPGRSNVHGAAKRYAGHHHGHGSSIPYYGSYDNKHGYESHQHYPKQSKVHSVLDNYAGPYLGYGSSTPYYGNHDNQHGYESYQQYPKLSKVHPVDKYAGLLSGYGSSTPHSYGSYGNPYGYENDYHHYPGQPKAHAVHLGQHRGYGDSLRGY